MKRPRLSLALARRLASHAAALAAFGAMASGGEMPAVASAVFLGCVVLSLAKRDRTFAGLGIWLTVAMAGAGVVLLLLVAQDAMDLVLAASLFAAAVCLHRLLGRRGPQDDPLLLLTTLMMLASGAALSGDAAYGLCFAFYGTAITAALTFSHLERSANAAGLSGNARDALLSRNLLAALFGLSVAALLGSAAVFVFFPRLNAQWIGRHHGAGRSPQMGFAEQVQLGGVGTLRSDPRPALRVRFPGLDGAALARLEDGEAHRLDLLWRGQALDTFDGHTWSAARARHHGRPVTPYPPKGFGLHADVEVLPITATQVLFSPGSAVAARLVRDDPSLRARSFTLLQRASGDLAIVPAPTEVYEYEVWTAAVDANALRGHGRSYPGWVKARDLQLPEQLDPRVRALAQRWVGTASDPADQAKAIAKHLREDFRYTTTLPGEVADPLAHFLFERKEGHCEYFSTAMVLMLRTLGVPAREVTGFSGGVPAPGADYFIVRAGDAHSWAEVYLPDVGYVAFDPTPPSARDDGPAGLAALWASITDTASEWWRRQILDYDLRSQLSALRAVGQTLAAANARFSRNPDRTGGPDPRKLAVIFLVLALVGSLGYRLRRWRRAARADGDEASLAYRRMLEVLARRGVTRAPNETARELASRLERAARAEAKPVGELAALYEQARFGGQPWREAERTRFERLLSSLRQLAG